MSSGPLDPPEQLSELTDDAVGLVFDQYAAVAASATAHLLAVLVEVERRGLPGPDGARSVGAWAAGRAGVERRTGEAWAATAERLTRLPVMWSTMAEGALSFDQVRHASVLAESGLPTDEPSDRDPEPGPVAFGASADDVRLTDMAQRHTAAALARAVSQARRSADDRDRSRTPSFEVRPARGGGSRLSGWLPEDLAEVVERGLGAEADRVPRRPDGTWVAPHERRAHALVALAGGRIAEDADPDRATIVLHAPADALPGASNDDEVAAVFGSGAACNSELLRRLACDARTQVVLDDRTGEPIALGTLQRTVPHWMRRLLVARDRWCAFPGCETTRHLHAHHLVHWADGGPTQVDNLLLLCPHHHRLVHDDRWTVERTRRGTTRWTRPDGTILHPGPHSRLSDLRRRLGRPPDPHHATHDQTEPLRPRPPDPLDPGLDDTG